MNCELFGVEKEIVDNICRCINSKSRIKLYVYPNIPEEKEATAKRTFANSVGKDEILCLIDTTLMGNADEGLVLTSKGICWTQVAFDSTGNFLSYNEIHEVVADTSFFGKGIKINDRYKVPLSAFDKESILELTNFLNFASKLCRNYTSKTSKVGNFNNEEVNQNSSDPENGIIKIFAELTKPDKNGGIYINPNIPDDKLVFAKKTFLKSNEKVLCLANYVGGPAFTTKGLYWLGRENGIQERFLSYYEIIDIDVDTSFSGCGLVINNYKIPIPSAEKQTLHELKQFLEATKEIFQSSRRTTNTVVLDNTEWYLAVNGKQFGPYTLDTIKSMINSKQINIKECLVWKNGMDNWVEFSKNPELAKLDEDVLFPPPPPFMVTQSSQVNNEIGDNAIEGNKTVQILDEPVNINAAEEEELITLPGIDIILAKKVIQARKQCGLFTSVNDFIQFIDVQPHVAEIIKTRVVALSCNQKSGRRIDF